MSRSQTMFHECVINSDEFLSLTVESQCLYLHLGFDASNIGELFGVKRLVRGYGFSTRELEELLDAGYLLEVDGRYFIAHYYVNNKLSSNKGMIEAANNSWESRPPGLEYEGGKHKSKLIVKSFAEDSANIERTFASTCNGNEPVNEPVPSPVFSPFPENPPRRGGIQREGEPSPMFPCPECGTLCLCSVDFGSIHGHCDEHGDFFTDPETGEYVEGGI